VEDKEKLKEIFCFPWSGKRLIYRKKIWRQVL